MERDTLILRYFNRKRNLEKFKKISAPEFLIRKGEKLLKEVIKKLGDVKRLEIEYAYWKIGEDLLEEKERERNKICEDCKFYIEDEDLPDTIFEEKDLGKMSWCKCYTIEDIENCKKRATLNKNIWKKED